MRLDGLSRLASRRRLDQVLVMNQGNIRALAGVNCDNAVLALSRRARTGGWSAALYTDFRYVPMVHRVAPKLACRDLKRLRASGARIGYEPSIPHSRFLALA